MKPLIIGEAPSKNEHPPTPIAGRIGKRLAACAGMSFEGFLEHFERTNLLSVRQDMKEKGFEFDMKAARVEACRLRASWKERRTVILLGKRVAAAFDALPIYFELYPADHDYYIVPHPSGVNRWWNDPKNVEQARNFMLYIVNFTCEEK